MAKSKKIQSLRSTPSRKSRGRTARTTARPQRDSQGALAREWRTDTNRPTSTGAGKARGDRRDMSKTYTNTTKHAARGNNPRRDVKTRKR